MGYHPRFTDIQPRGTNNPTVEERIKLLERMREEINASSRIAAEMVRNRAGTSIPPFKKGDKVWLEGRNITTTHPSVKLAPKRHRPFTIEDMLGPVTAKLRLPHQWKIHPVFHTSLLTPFKSTPEHGAPFPKPPPDIINDEEQYEVETILDSRYHYGKLQYLVKWFGYPTSDNTWEPWQNVENAREETNAFHTAYPEKPQFKREPKGAPKSRQRKKANIKAIKQDERYPLCPHRTPRRLTVPRDTLLLLLSLAEILPEPRSHNTPVDLRSILLHDLNVGE